MAGLFAHAVDVDFSGLDLTLASAGVAHLGAHLTILLGPLVLLVGVTMDACNRSPRVEESG